MTACPACARLLPLTVHYCPYCGTEVKPARPGISGRFDWGLLGQWLGVTALAWAIAWVVLTHPLVSRLLPTAAIGAPAMALAGLVIGAAQWLILRARARRDPWWALVTPVAWGAAGYLFIVLLPVTGAGQPLLSQLARVTRFVLIGAVVGLGQWIAIRQLATGMRPVQWVLASAASFGYMLVTVVAAATQGASLGWFPMLTFGTAGSPVFQVNDLLFAGFWGLVLGGGEYLALRGRVRGAGWWPVATCLGLLAAATLADGLLATLQALAASGAVSYRVSAGPAEQALAWGLAGAGFGAAQVRVLRGSGRRARWLVPLSIAGCLAGWGLVTVGIVDDWLLTCAMVAGLASGVPLWLAARLDFRQSGWLPVWSSAIWAVVMMAGALAGFSAGARLTSPMLLTAALGLLPGVVLAYRA